MTLSIAEAALGVALGLQISTVGLISVVPARSVKQANTIVSCRREVTIKECPAREQIRLSP